MPGPTEAPTSLGDVTTALYRRYRPESFDDVIGQEHVTEPLMQALRVLRSSLAVKAHVPAYVIFPDAALADMCAKKPKTIEEFLSVSGVGQAKAEKYGEAFLRVICHYSD